ncbi:MATE family efflux transporter, partial [Marinilactibacillus psychrotolerans]|uniref:MATE family efflux transporter n=1 Tax=Marinilactibacillus psychrotolerans TaxID=191770 RepID=UPI00388435A9
NRLVLNLSLPMMISMLIQSLYNVVDSMFVAQISEEALAALSLGAPGMGDNLVVKVHYRLGSRNC